MHRPIAILNPQPGYCAGCFVDGTIPSTERVYQAVRELCAHELLATRETVTTLTGMKLSIVDDRLSMLVDDGRLKRLIRGIYELVEEYPAPCGKIGNQRARSARIGK